MPESNFQHYWRVQWLETAVCPFCTEANTPNRSMIITLEDDGTAVCWNCSKSWTPTLPSRV